MSEVLIAVLAFALGFFVGGWDERHLLTWRGRWEGFIHHFGHHTVSEYTGRCMVCDAQLKEPAVKREYSGLMAKLAAPIERKPPDA